MAKQQQEQLPGEGATDQEQAAAVQIGQMMGPTHDEFDDRVQALHDKRHQAEHDAADYDSIYGGERPHEASYAKMHEAQMGLAPTDIEKEEAQQRQTQAQSTAAQQAATASQAQAQQSPVNAPPAPAGPVGVNVPYEAQKGAQEAPSAENLQPQAGGGLESPASQIQPPPAPEEEGQ